MKKVIFIFFILLCNSFLFPMYELLNSIDNTDSISTYNKFKNAEDKFNSDSQFRTVAVYDANMSPLGGIKIKDSVGNEYFTDDYGTATVNNLERGIEIFGRGYNKSKYSMEELIQSDFKCILLKERKKANFKVKSAKNKNSNQMSRNFGTGGIELPEGRTAGEGKTSFGMGLEFSDHKNLNENDYMNIDYSLSYGLTPKFDMGITLSDKNEKSGTSESKIESGYLKYNIGEMSINDTNLNFALSAKSRTIDNTDIYGIFGINKENYQLNLIAQKNGTTGKNNYGFMYRKHLMPLFTSEILKNNYFIFEMMQDSNDKLSKINVGYRAFIKKMSLDVYFKRDLYNDIRSSGVGASWLF